LRQDGIDDPARQSRRNPVAASSVVVGAGRPHNHATAPAVFHRATRSGPRWMGGIDAAKPAGAFDHQTLALERIRSQRRCSPCHSSVPSGGRRWARRQTCEIRAATVPRKALSASRPAHAAPETAIEAPETPARMKPRREWLFTFRILVLLFAGRSSALGELYSSPATTSPGSPPTGRRSAV
jgi:hypothetical protein